MLGGAGKNYSAPSNSDSWVIELRVPSPVLLLLLTRFASIPAATSSFCPARMREIMTQ